MSKPGWYPDPGGQPGMFRYWSGSAWSAAVTPNPPTAAGEPVMPSYQYQIPTDLNRPRPKFWTWLLIGVVVIALAIGVAFAIRTAIGAFTGGSDGGGGGTNPSLDICPKPKKDTKPRQHPNDGYVHGGQLAYPHLGPPWGEPTSDDRVPFGTDVKSQSILIEDNYDKKGHSWVASILIGELVAGDGFFSPKEGADIVTRCVIGAFYGDAKVGREDIKNQAMTVQGKEAWIVETHLTFSIPNLKTKGETAIIVIVRTSEESSSLYYASIPDTSPQFLPVARDTMNKLRVSR